VSECEDEGEGEGGECETVRSFSKPSFSVPCGSFVVRIFRIP
jgi:hypothetical protein